MAIARYAGVPALHAPMVSWDENYIGRIAIERLRAALMTTDSVLIESDPAEPTAVLSSTGKASGVLLGGNQDSIATSAGWALPPLDGAILLLEAFNLRLGHIDRQLTMLRIAGHLDGVAAVAVGQYTRCGPEQDEPQAWSYLSVLRDHLDPLGVPVLGGLAIGHGRHPRRGECHVVGDPTGVATLCHPSGPLAAELSPRAEFGSNRDRGC
jgi:muramoyltetrapeptide carboxypeptidase